ncbi:hypothetical protein Val02_56310 [Virgisporangium aliadipatigenens]|uniref:NADAR domain-containing protein n=1 Tax=Virgisporangium aliadipatigenens TaxID=741659 RepID=A0A8J4DS22_9ACTN|nr:NADAR family protein [Virgisporangium aliadipatigenens]GIJ48745.1 hypothetical protein Val02_56310 [Virgisporangium aliadipatigenens]
MDVAELIRRTDAGERIKYLFFWGHRPQRDGSVGAGCLSQWWPAPFSVDGRIFATAEHYMMWRKATLFGDADAAERVLAATHPNEAKTVGRQVRGFDADAWEAACFDIVVAGNEAKFRQRQELSAFLLGTGGRVLVEASPLDRVWGIGLAADDPRAGRPREWLGRNLLGFALMNVRETLLIG